MNTCRNCEFELPEASGFCPMCGVPLLEEAANDGSEIGPSEEIISGDIDALKSAPGDEGDAPNEDEVEPILNSEGQEDKGAAPIPESPPARFSEPVGFNVDQSLIGHEGPETDIQVEGDSNASDEGMVQGEEEVSANDDLGNGPPAEIDDAASLDSPTDEPLDLGQTAHSLQDAETDGRRSVKGLKPLTEGTVLNSRYRIVRRIGGGGMGAVYLACDQNLGDIERAVKEMVHSSIEEEQQIKAIEDFKRESTILSTLDHPSIPTIYDYFFDESEGRFYLVMKYISGGDLAGRLRTAPGGRLDEKTVTEWAIQVADVLSYLHNLPTTIVYRDLKPSNIMLDGATGKIMLIDFGIARSINQQEKGVTAVGTMGYAPPELFSGQVEPRSDIYSLGSTMFHLLTGADPQNNPLLIFDFQKNPRPRQINPQLSDQMERILMRSVEYNAESRFASADALKATLLEHLDRLRTGQITFGVSEVPAAVSLNHQFVFCGFCGQQIVASDLFCAFCGAKQPIAQQGVHAEIYPRTAATAKLLVDGTSELDSPVFALEKNENLLGRRDPQSNIFPEVDLSKFDPQTKISRRHARIWREGGSFLVEDLGSSNGTVLFLGTNDSVRLQPRQPYPLTSGDRLRLGDTTLYFMMS